MFVSSSISAFPSNNINSSLPQSLLSWIDSTKSTDPRIFFEESRKVKKKNCVSIIIIFRCNDDLLLQNDLKIEVLIGFAEENLASSIGETICHIQSVRFILVSEKDRQYIGDKYLVQEENQSDLASSSFEIIVPWLSTTAITEPFSYPLTVYLFSIRSLLKNPSLPSYHCSILLHKEFRGYSSTVTVPLSSSTVNSCNTPTRLFFGVGKSRGRRNYMEDVEFIYQHVKINEKELISVFGVLDGHGGMDCAQFVSDDIPSRVTALLRKQTIGDAKISVAEALYQTFKEIDQDYLRVSGSNNAGSTACILLFHNQQNTIYVANTGDTRAILSHNHIAIDLSYDRKATDPEEIARIIRHGGFVSNGRVMGILAVSRAFGDNQLKRNLTNPVSNSEIVLVDPEISLFSPVIHDEFVVIATDGLWDVMSSQQVVDFVLEALKQESIEVPLNQRLFEDTEYGSQQFPSDLFVNQLNRIAAKLVTHCIEQLRSGDNVTVMIVLISSFWKKRAPASLLPSSTGSSIKVNPENCRINTFPISLPPKQAKWSAFGTDNIDDTVKSISIPSSAKGETFKKETSIDPSMSRYSSRITETSTVQHVNKSSHQVNNSEDDLMDFLKDDKNFMY